MDKPVFITGATGSIGSALARRLVDQGTRLRLLVRDRTKVAPLQALPGVDLVLGDIGQIQSLQGVLDGCGVVFHCAAKLHGSDRAAYERVNVRGTEALAQAAVRAQVDRFVHISSVAAYGYPNQRDITEEDKWLEPSRDPYVSTKQQAEKVLRRVYAGSELALSIARPGDVYGPGQSTWTIEFVQSLRRRMLYPPTVSSSGLANLVYIDNLVDALLLLGQHPKAVGQAFNIVDQSVSIHDYILMLAKMAHVSTMAVPGSFLTAAGAVLEFLGELGGREASITKDSVSFLLHQSTFSSRKLRSELGWTPGVSLEEGQRRTEAWLRAHQYL